MKRWLRRLRGALGLGLVWGLAWAPLGVLIGLIVDPDNSMDEMWAAIGAYPGFLAGVAFSMTLWVAERRRSFEQLSVPRFAAWGALAGAVLGMIPFLAISGSPLPRWLLGIVFVGPLALAGAASAAETLALARRADERGALPARGVQNSTGGFDVTVGTTPRKRPQQ